MRWQLNRVVKLFILVVALPLLLASQVSIVQADTSNVWLQYVKKQTQQALKIFVGVGASNSSQQSNKKSFFAGAGMHSEGGVGGKHGFHFSKQSDSGNPVG